MNDATKESAQSQLDKFKEAARELECDYDTHLKERLGKLVMQKPTEKPAPEKRPE